MIQYQLFYKSDLILTTFDKGKLLRTANKIYIKNRGLDIYYVEAPVERVREKEQVFKFNEDEEGRLHFDEVYKDD